MSHARRTPMRRFGPRHADTRPAVWQADAYRLFARPSIRSGNAFRATLARVPATGRMRRVAARFNLLKD